MQAFANLDVTDYTFTPVASISVIQSTRCLLSAIPSQHLLPPPNAPHQPTTNGVAVRRSDCMRLLEDIVYIIF